MAKAKFKYEKSEVFAEVPDSLLIILQLLDYSIAEYQDDESEENAWETGYDFVSDELRKTFCKITNVSPENLGVDFNQLNEIDALNRVDISVSLEKVGSYENKNN